MLDSPYPPKQQLAIGHGLSLSTDVYRERELTGFGLVLVNDSTPCFSWEWFDREGGDVFSKRRGNGKVKVGVVESAETRELASVTFLDASPSTVKASRAEPFTKCVSGQTAC